MKIDPKTQPKGYRLRFSVYVHAEKDARILLTSTQTPDAVRDNVYEIRLGVDGNTKSTISRKINGAFIAQVYEQNILQLGKLVQVVVEVLNDGTINVFTSHNPFVPLISAKDANLLDINYVSFASSCRVLYYYDINEKWLLNLPTITTLPTEVTEVTENVKHPFLAELEYPVGLSGLCKCLLVKKEEMCCET